MTFYRSDEISDAIRRAHAQEEQNLAPYAVRTGQSRGRRHPERAHPYRTEYQRDRDRIIHSAAFRRLMYKTQVFVGQPDDHQRNRLTHTLEVAQIARTVARNLRLNEDLTEAIALAHDLGHPPFGHAGERALAQAMVNHGGFNHNRHGLRLLQQLEHRYPAFCGLNLTYELLESIALRGAVEGHRDLAPFNGEQQMILESQVVDACDNVAYDTHDIDDALRAGLIHFDDLRTVKLWRRAEERARVTYGNGLEGKQLARAVIRSLIDWQVSSLLAESHHRLEAIDSVVAVKQCSQPLIVLEEELAGLRQELEAFLFEHVYRHEQVVRTTHVAARMVQQLFDELLREPGLLPAKYR